MITKGKRGTGCTYVRLNYRSDDQEFPGAFPQSIASDFCNSLPTLLETFQRWLSEGGPLDDDMNLATEMIPDLLTLGMISRDLHHSLFHEEGLPFPGPTWILDLRLALPLYDTLETIFRDYANLMQITKRHYLEQGPGLSAFYAIPEEAAVDTVSNTDQEAGLGDVNHMSSASVVTEPFVTYGVNEDFEARSVDEAFEVLGVEDAYHTPAVDEDSGTRSADEASRAHGVDEASEAPAVKADPTTHSSNETSEAAGVDEVSKTPTTNEQFKTNSADEAYKAPAVDEDSATRRADEAYRAHGVDEASEAPAVNADSKTHGADKAIEARVVGDEIEAPALNEDPSTRGADEAYEAPGVDENSKTRGADEDPKTGNPDEMSRAHGADDELEAFGVDQGSKTHGTDEAPEASDFRNVDEGFSARPINKASTVLGVHESSSMDHEAEVGGLAQNIAAEVRIDILEEPPADDTETTAQDSGLDELVNSDQVGEAQYNQEESG